MTANPLAALIADVPLHDSHHDHGGWMYHAEVLAALASAVPDGLVEKAEVIISALHTHGSGFHVDDDLQRWIIPATDLITALLAHIAAQEARVKEAEAETHACGAEREAWKARAEAAETALAAAQAREAKLREALEAITQQAAKDARDVFSEDRQAKEAVDYMEQLIYAHLRKLDAALSEGAGE